MFQRLSLAAARAAGLALTLLPALALAWTPYGAGPYPVTPGADQGAQPMDPGLAPFEYDRGFSRDLGPNFCPDFDQFFGRPFPGRNGQTRDWTPPFGPPMSGAADPQHSFGPGGPMGQRSGLRIDRRATDDAYLMDIQLSGVQPAEVEVRVQGPWVLISRKSAAQSSQEETLSDGRGYRRSFSYSSGQMSQRFNLPRDADGAALQRQDTEEAVHISIPRTKPAAR
jgi:HSP20 family molecular chaperone IbpA